MFRADFPSEPGRLAASLEDWFSEAARQLPWREERTPYRVWLSEVMLQQTRVATVIDYFHRFLARFPDVHALAAAPEDDVLALWSGLGYYARGRNLHRAAKVVAWERGGVFPERVEELCALPGIGPYTAGAIASLAFGKRAPIVDGNVARILARVCDDDVAIDSPEGRERMDVRARVLVEAATDPARLNEGMMELGALVCTPRSPACLVCPWRTPCRSRAQGTVDERPQKLPRRARRTLRVASAVIRDSEGAVWLERRAQAGLFGGLYEPPSTAIEENDDPRAAIQALLETRGVSLAATAALRGPVVVERTLTHRDLRFEVFALCLSAAEMRADAPLIPPARWSEIGLSRAIRAVLDAAPADVAP